MDKEQILSTINEKLGQTSLSNRTINDYVSANLPAEGVEPDDAYWIKHTGILKSLNGNFSADVAAQVEDFKKNFKPSTITNPKQEWGGKTDLEKRLEQLEAQLKASSTAQNAAQLRNKAVEEGKSLKVASSALWEDAVKAVEIGEKDSADDVTAKAKKIYEGLQKRYFGDAATPYGTSNRQGASEEAKKEHQAKRDEFKKRMQSRGKLPKSE